MDAAAGRGNRMKGDDAEAVRLPIYTAGRKVNSFATVINKMGSYVH